MVSAERALLIYLACAQIAQYSSVRAEYSMGCACGLRSVDNEEEEDCNESAKLEDTEAGTLNH